MSASAKVYLVGAGPGDYKLITLKALECIRQADAIIYDESINKYYLKEAKEGCELIYAGKVASHHSLPQWETNNLMLAKFKEGKMVVRLKGGDPYVFGRGGEEAVFLYDNNIPFETVPGVTSAVGGLAYAGIPVTCRGYASSFYVCTGHKSINEPDWELLAKTRGTVVFLMGIHNIDNIKKKMLLYGKPKDTPMAIISNASRANQNVIVTTLEDATTKNIAYPGLIVMGEVVTLRNKLNFFERRPLLGKNIMITRSKCQSSLFAQKIMEQGGNPIDAATIKINKFADTAPLKREIEQIRKYKYLVFTSQNTVEFFFEVLAEMNCDARAIYGPKIAVIGPQTAKALQNKGIKADIIPRSHYTEGLVASLAPLLCPTDSILVPCAKNARPILPQNLKADVNMLPIYETMADYSQRDEIINHLDSGNLHYITFASPSAVASFVQLVGQENLGKLAGVKVICIGPVTAKRLMSFGIAAIQAEKTCINAMIDLMN